MCRDLTCMMFKNKLKPISRGYIHWHLQQGRKTTGTPEGLQSPGVKSLLPRRQSRLVPGPLTQLSSLTFITCLLPEWGSRPRVVSRPSSDFPLTSQLSSHSHHNSLLIASFLYLIFSPRSHPTLWLKHHYASVTLHLAGLSTPERYFSLLGHCCVCPFSLHACPSTHMTYPTCSEHSSTSSSACRVTSARPETASRFLTPCLPCVDFCSESWSSQRPVYLTFALIISVPVPLRVFLSWIHVPASVSYLPSHHSPPHSTPAPILCAGTQWFAGSVLSPAAAAASAGNMLEMQILEWGSAIWI